MKVSETKAFDALPADVQAVLKRAASRGAANLPNGMTLRIGADWLMVPVKGGVRQVAVGMTRAFRL